MTTRESRDHSKWATCGICIYTGVVGLALLALGWGAILKNAIPAASAVFLLGGAALVAAPFVSRLEGKLRIGPMELTLREQVVKALRSADEDSLEGVLPLLTSEEVSVARVQVPRRFVGRRLIDPELSFLRQRLNVSVLAIREPGSEKWRAGGEISELSLVEKTELLIAGHRDTVRYLRFLIASDDEESWQRVT